MSLSGILAFKASGVINICSSLIFTSLNSLFFISSPVTYYLHT
ncbi:Uncharacterised protein [Vibrio cholerae]|nr:Uncharacterised protein [Vibrio cholerae]